MGTGGKVIGRFIVGSVEDMGVVECYDYSTGKSGPVQQTKVRLQAVTRENDNTDFDNDSFYRSTPQGHIEMVIQNPDAAEQFQSGDAFNVTFDRLPKS